MKQILPIICLLMFSYEGISQSVTSKTDSIQTKIKHADPVFEDLTTALGVRKGEKELNMNFGYANLQNNHHILESQLFSAFLGGAGIDPGASACGMAAGFQHQLQFSLWVF